MKGLVLLASSPVLVLFTFKNNSNRAWGKPRVLPAARASAAGQTVTRRVRVSSPDSVDHFPPDSVDHFPPDSVDHFPPDSCGSLPTGHWRRSDRRDRPPRACEPCALAVQAESRPRPPVTPTGGGCCRQIGEDTGRTLPTETLKLLANRGDKASSLSIRIKAFDEERRKVQRPQDAGRLGDFQPRPL